MKYLILLNKISLIALILLSVACTEDKSAPDIGTTESAATDSTVPEPELVPIAVIPPQYNITDLGTLGGDSSSANSINNMGDIVGSSFNENGVNRAFHYNMSNMTDIGYLQSYSIQSSRAQSLNDDGIIVGDDGNDTINFYTNGWRYSNGQMSALSTGYTEAKSVAYDINNIGVIVGSNRFPWVTSRNRAFAHYPGDTYLTDLGELDLDSKCGGAAFAINNLNQIVGYAGAYGNLRCDRRAFLFDNGVMNDLGTLGGLDSSAHDINEDGVVVGSSKISQYGATEAFIYKVDEMQSLGTLGGTDSSATAVNNTNHIVGNSEIQGDQFRHAFIYVDNTMYDLNDLVLNIDGWDYLWSATDINDQEQIVGIGLINGKSRAFLLNPIQ